MCSLRAKSDEETKRVRHSISSICTFYSASFWHAPAFAEVFFLVPCVSIGPTSRLDNPQGTSLFCIRVGWSAIVASFFSRTGAALLAVEEELNTLRCCCLNSRRQLDTKVVTHTMRQFSSSYGIWKLLLGKEFVFCFIMRSMLRYARILCVLPLFSCELWFQQNQHEWGILEQWGTFCTGTNNVINAIETIPAKDSAAATSPVCRLLEPEGNYCRSHRLWTIPTYANIEGNQRFA